MKTIPSVLLAAVMFLIGVHTGETQAATFDDEHVLQCSALFYLMKSVHTELGDDDKAQFYAAKFEKLEFEARDIFGDTEAHVRIQEYIDLIMQAGIAQPRSIKAITEICDGSFS